MTKLPKEGDLVAITTITERDELVSERGKFIRGDICL